MAACKLTSHVHAFFVRGFFDERGLVPKGGLMRPVGNIVLAATLACASQAAIAQTKPVRVCTTELNLYPIEANAPEKVTRPPYIQPPSLPPDFPMEAKASSTVIVTVPVAWTEKGHSATFHAQR